MPNWDSAGVGAISEIALLTSRAHMRSVAANRHTPVLRSTGFIEARPSIGNASLRNLLRQYVGARSAVGSALPARFATDVTAKDHAVARRSKSSAEVVVGKLVR